MNATMNAKEIKDVLGITFKRIEKTGTKRDDEIIHNVNRFLDAAMNETDRNIKYGHFRTYVHALNTLHEKAVDDFDLDDVIYDLLEEFPGWR